MDYITFSTKGKAVDFGNLLAAKNNQSGFSSSTRGISGGGNTGSKINVIEYITIASVGNSTDFGDLTAVRDRHSSVSSTTRGLFAGGRDGSGNVNTIEYITICLLYTSPSPRD